MRIEQVIGQRVAKAREEEGWTQTELGHQLGQLLSKSWSRQAVWNAEQGKRVFTAVELLALAHTFGTTVQSLLQPFDEIESIEFPSGEQVEWHELMANGLPDSPSGLTLGEIHSDVADVQHLLADLTGAVNEMSQHVEKAIQEARIK